MQAPIQFKMQPLVRRNMTMTALSVERDASFTKETTNSFFSTRIKKWDTITLHPAQKKHEPKMTDMIIFSLILFNEACRKHHHNC